MIITNAFSLNMLAEVPATIHVRDLTPEEARDLLEEGPVASAVGHADTARLFAEELGVPIPMARRTLILAPGDTVLVGQYRGPRLPEGATTLPEGATITWLLVEIA